MGASKKHDCWICADLPAPRSRRRNAPGVGLDAWSFLDTAPRPSRAAPTPPTPATDVMQAHEVADMLGLDRNTVYEAAGRLALPHRRIGRRMLFSRTAIAEWLRTSETRKR